MTTQTWNEDDRVEGGMTAEDYDAGRVYYRDGALMVAWDSGVSTPAEADELRAEGTLDVRDIESWAARMAASDRDACELAETEMDGEWSGAHAEALADHLGVSVAELSEDALDVARRAYRAHA